MVHLDLMSRVQRVECCFSSPKCPESMAIDLIIRLHNQACPFFGLCLAGPDGLRLSTRCSPLDTLPRPGFRAGRKHNIYIMTGCLLLCMYVCFFEPDAHQNVSQTVCCCKHHHFKLQTYSIFLSLMVRLLLCFISFAKCVAVVSAIASTRRS